MFVVIDSGYAQFCVVGDWYIKPWKLYSFGNDCYYKKATPRLDA